jgi:uncharacterized membrane protein
MNQEPTAVSAAASEPHHLHDLLARHPAWRRRTRGEGRIAVTIAIIVAIAMGLELPARVANRPRLLAPAVALIVLCVLIAINPKRIEREGKAARVLSLTLIGVMSLANAASGARLIVDLTHATGIRDPSQLLLTGASIWLTNILVFSLWYWEIDRGGPVHRALGTREHPDFLFPQMQSPEMCVEHWEPKYVDYLYLSFTNATAFSPTDVLPLTRWAKLMMLLQSLISLATIGLVIARAVNVLK